MKKILILTAGYGEGHNSAARCIQAGLARNASDAQVECHDLFAETYGTVNEWMRKEAGLDAVLDFDHIVRAANDPDSLNPAYNCGDGIHPSPIGYFLMGKSVDLGVFGAR